MRRSMWVGGMVGGLLVLGGSGISSSVPQAQAADSVNCRSSHSYQLLPGQQLNWKASIACKRPRYVTVGWKAIVMKNGRPWVTRTGNSKTASVTRFCSPGRTYATFQMVVYYTATWNTGFSENGATQSRTYSLKCR